MRTIVLASALLTGVLMVQSAGAQSAPPLVAAGNGAKIGYVNSERLMQDAPGANEARTTVQREYDKYRAELALLEDSIKNLVNDYQQKQVMLSPDAKKKQEDMIRAKQAAFTQRTQQADAALEKRSQELLQPVMDRVNKALNDLRKEEGYALILNTAGGTIVSADSALDLTTKVLAKLGKPATATPPKKPGS